MRYFLLAHPQTPFQSSASHEAFQAETTEDFLQGYDIYTYMGVTGGFIDYNQFETFTSMNWTETELWLTLCTVTNS